MDVTSLFKTCVEISRKQNKDLETILDSPAGIANPGPGPAQNGNITTGTGTGGKLSCAVSKSKLFPGKKTEYYSHAKDILTALTGLRKYLQETRIPYLNIGSHTELNTKTPFRGGNSNSQTSITELTNAERDQVDQDVQQIIQTCQKRIFEFQRLVDTTGAEEKQPQLYTHLESVISSLGVYLKEIVALYSEMRAIRVKRTVDFQAMARLSKGTGGGNGFEFSRSSVFKGATSEVDGAFSKSDQKPSTSTSTSSRGGYSDYHSQYFEDELELTPEEVQVLEAENAELFDELNSLSDEVDQIQTSVVKIAQLQTIFTEKVLEQDLQIERTVNLTVGATENIKDGNEQVRQAIQQSADFRAWVLFFIVVMSLSLLFLDWYND